MISENHVSTSAEQSRSDRSSTSALMTKAGALLMDAAGMLRLEAQEWRSRKRQMATGGEWTPTTWADKCERVAAINDKAATAMVEHAKKLAEAAR
jgi:hypothetical protein